MKRFAFFPGCKIPHHLEGYGRSSLALLRKYDVDPVGMEFNCCGYPVRDLNFEAFLLSGAKNLALAENAGLDIVTPCKCCFGSLKFVEYFLDRDEALRTRINGWLKEDGLAYNGRSRANHLLSVLHKEVGLETIGKSISTAYKDLKVAVHTGCHALRPARITGFDNPFSPRVFEDLIQAAGAKSVFWSLSGECCGNPQWDKNRPLAVIQMNRKLQNARQYGADVIGTACTYCQLQFDQARDDTMQPAAAPVMPSILATQIIGLAVGLSREDLGLSDRDHAFLSRFA